MTNNQSEDKISRRNLLKAGASAAAFTSVAGCAGGNGNSGISGDTVFTDLQKNQAKTTMSNAFDDFRTAVDKADQARSGTQDAGIPSSIDEFDIDAEDGNGGVLLNDEIALGIAFTDDEGEPAEDRSYPNDSIERADTGLEYVHQGGVFDTLDSADEYESQLNSVVDAAGLNISVDSQNVASAIFDEIDENVGVFWAEDKDGDDRFDPRFSESDLDELQAIKQGLEGAIVDYAQSVSDIEEAISKVQQNKSDLDIAGIHEEINSDGALSAEEGSTDAELLAEDHFTSEEASDYLEGEGDYDSPVSLSSDSSAPEELVEAVGELDDQYGDGLEGVYQALQDEREELASEAAVTLQTYSLVDQIIDKAGEVTGIEEEPEEPDEPADPGNPEDQYTMDYSDLDSCEQDRADGFFGDDAEDYRFRDAGEDIDYLTPDGIQGAMDKCEW